MFLHVHRCMHANSGPPPWTDAFWANETVDAVKASIAKRAAAGAHNYGYVRLWLAERRPRRRINVGMDAMTRRCYARELKRLQEQPRPRPQRERPVDDDG